MKIDYVTIFTSKIDESLQFYSDIIGLTLEKRVDHKTVTLIFLSDGNGVNVELVDTGVELPFVENCPVAITTLVEDITEIEKMINENSLTISFGPFTTPTGYKIIHIKDPNGVVINFVEETK